MTDHIDTDEDIPRGATGKVDLPQICTLLRESV